MPVRKLCKTNKTKKTVPHRKDGKCPKGSREVRKTVKKGGKKKSSKKKRTVKRK